MTTALRHWLRRQATFSRDYGMAAVLLLLCGYYAFATYQEQQPVGGAAARQLLGQISAQFPATTSALIVAREGADDAAFVAELESALAQLGWRDVRKVQGDPRATRAVLQTMADEGRRLEVVATTSECAMWTLWQDLPRRLPKLGEPRVIFAQSYKWPTFLKADNLINVANQTVVVAVLAAGMTFVIIAGGIDLSVGSLIALSAVTTTLLIRDHGGAANASVAALVLCSLAGVGVCALTGLFSGLMITAFRVPAFIATLAVMQVASGLAYILAKGGSIYELPDRFTWLGRGLGWGTLPNGVVLMGLVYLLAHFVMSKTTLGRYVYAIGGNPEVARLSGVNVRGVLLLVYTLSAAFAGLGGVIMASQLKSGSPTYGASYELYVIAAVVVGGASLSGGEGKVIGTLIGTFIIAVIQNGMNLTGVESYTQKIVLGIVILVAVLLDTLKNQDWRRLRTRWRFLRRNP